MKYLTIIFVLIEFKLFCQIGNSYEIIEVPVYEIINESFKQALDSFIINEMQYEYYDSNVVLHANVMNYDGTAIQLSSGCKNCYSQVVYDIYADSTLGIFYYKSHIFTIFGRSIVNSKLMKKTNEKFKIYLISSKEQSDNINNTIDDSYFPTTWFGILEGDKFIIKNKFPMYLAPKE